MTKTKATKAGARTRKTLAERLVGAVFEGDSGAFKPKTQTKAEQLAGLLPPGTVVTIQQRPKPISFKVTKAEAVTIGEITKRACEMAKQQGIRYDGMSANMDITACHANGNPLLLEKLLAADDFNFAHDVFGIARHIDRKTGQLQNCFSPRCSA